MITTTFTAKEGKNNFGRLLDEARLSPVAIEKNGRRVAVVVSSEEYAEFELRRDTAWGQRAEQAHKKGYIGTARSRTFLTEALNARD
ncbi:MAG: type II toxin-antitoxin system prevent-host-death family antitoxin [bacterium]|nr:type II toxin-antitoxin system prevent-host-death family antitoxin [bacterium]